MKHMNTRITHELEFTEEELTVLRNDLTVILREAPCGSESADNFLKLLNDIIGD